jgi:hypothetical protein
MIATVNIRPVIKPAGAPLWWVRLAALAHAGVLTDAMTTIANTERLLEWAAGLFTAHYRWTTAIDLHEAPRSRPEWIDPDYFFAELVGRVLIAISCLPAAERPTEWIHVVDAAVEELKTSGLLLVTQFSGPFDDFDPSAIAISSTFEPFLDTEAKLETATQLGDMPELFALVRLCHPSEKVVANIRRITMLPADEPLSQGEDLKYLRIAARIGASARNTTIGKAVVNRCILLAQQSCRQQGIIDILEVMVEACAAYSEAATYRKQVGDAVASICLAANTRLDLQDVLLLISH